MYCLERFEGNYAVCEDENKTSINIEIDRLYQGAKAGDWFFEENGEYVYSKEKTDENKQKNIALLKKIMGKK